MRTYELKNLNCPNCAAKIEARVGGLPQVSEAKLDFISKRLVVEGAISGEEIQQLVDSIEDGVVVVEKNHGEKKQEAEEEEGSLKNELISIACGIMAALLVQFVYKGSYQTVLWAVILAAAGFDIFRNAIRTHVTRQCVCHRNQCFL